MTVIRPSKNAKGGICCLCKKHFERRFLHAVDAQRPALAEMIHAEIGPTEPDALVCENDLARLRREAISKMLEDERGELSELDQRVIHDLGTGISTVQQIAQEKDQTIGFGDRAADAVASFGGSWAFILLFIGILVAWMILNTVILASNAFDPYPFILLNLVLSCVAALQAPIIMMSQRRQEEKDRKRAENDYMVNLRAELEIRQLHEKIDHQMARQWERLAEMQQIQIDLLEAGHNRRNQ
ncbi:DUF1003 domain-containing protein [Allorhizobium undicola]|uniref:DUF1003 domain-containing protein n=1 Tax=Allorhizobium undicola TaxID=78527 RepID=UPI000A01E021|nr:DUF1003 domain-containing protein [Allorhizobium undicola]